MSAGHDGREDEMEGGDRCPVDCILDVEGGDVLRKMLKDQSTVVTVDSTGQIKDGPRLQILEVYSPTSLSSGMASQILLRLCKSHSAARFLR